MDIVDDAQQAEALLVRSGIAAARRVRDLLPPIGRCYNCDASLPPGVRFCDADCRDDHQRQQRARTIAGRNP